MLNFKQICTSLKNSFQFFSECVIHEGVDDWVSHIVDEIQIEYNYVKLNNLNRHEPCWKEGEDEDNRHNKQHCCCSDVCQEVKVSTLLAGFLLRVVERLHLTSLVAIHCTVLRTHLDFLDLRCYGDRRFLGGFAGSLSTTPFPPLDDGAIDESVDDTDNKKRYEVKRGVYLLISIQEVWVEN